MAKNVRLFALLCLMGCSGGGGDCNGSGSGEACCKMCSAGQACGDTCISANSTCNAGPGCACNASPIQEFDASMP